MIQETYHKVNTSVPRTSHAVDPEFRITITEFKQGMDPKCVGKTKRGRINNAAYFLKKRSMAWADDFPKKIDGIPSGFTPAVREVFKAVVWSHLMNRGYAVFSYDTLAAATRCHRETVWRAVNFLRDKGLIQIKTGKGWGRKDRRNLANQYTPNFWAFINPETGTIIDPPHHTGTYEWKATATRYRERLEMGPQSENVTMVSRQAGASSDIENGGQSENVTMVSRQAGASSDIQTETENGGQSENVTMVSRQAGASSDIEKETDHSNKMLLRSEAKNGGNPPDHSNKMLLYSDNGIGCAPAAPASPDGTTDCAPATPEGNGFDLSEKEKKFMTRWEMKGIDFGKDTEGRWLWRVDDGDWFGPFEDIGKCANNIDDHTKGRL